MLRRGRKSAAQTPAPAKDRIYGSKTNPKGSASSEKSAKAITLSDKIIFSLRNKLKEFKEKHPTKKNITLADLKAVYRRGLGAYSSTHRPTITGGVPNTRNAWAMARVNKFLLKAGGTKVKAAYVQDDDLMKYAKGGEITISDDEYNFYVGGEEYEGKAIKENGVVVGGIAYDEDDEEIKGITIKNKFRNKGFAKQAVKKLFENNKNLKSVYVRAVPKAKSFWEKIGTDFEDYNEDAGLWEGTLKRFEDGGLIAPNGKPSNLTPEQYKLVRTPEFKGWFGDWQNDPEQASKVVDENGEPLVVYHGSDNKFNVFDIKRAVSGFHGLGFYFSDTDLDYGKIIYDCFLNFKNPFYINGEYSLSEIKNILGDSYNQIQETIKEEIENSFNGKVGGFVFYNLAGNDNLKKQGYDGLIHSNVYVAFKANQIKLADGTNTTFDADSDDIRYEDGGEIENDGFDAERYIFDATPEQAKLYGFDAEKPLYIIDLTKEQQIKEILEYASKNGNDVIFGHIVPEEDQDIESIKSMLIKSGFNTCEGNDDFYKVMEKEIKLPDLNLSYDSLKRTLNMQGYEIEPMKKQEVGKLAKGMSVQQIAQHHNTTVENIQEQLDKGTKVEMEHTDNQDIARAIALDHVYESPVYYDKLATIEEEFKDGGVVVGKRHSEYDENGSGEKFLVESTGQVVELEGGEGVLCQESMSSDKKFNFDGKSMTGREIASYLNHKYGGVEFAKGGEVKKIDKIIADKPHVCGCKHQYYHGGELPTAVVRNLKGGEAVVTVKSMESQDKYYFNGRSMTPRQIFSAINLASGGKKFEDGGTIDLKSIRMETEVQLAKMMYYVRTLNIEILNNQI